MLKDLVLIILVGNILNIYKTEEEILPAVMRSNVRNIGATGRNS